MWVGGQPHSPAASTPEKDPVPIIQEAGWTPGPVWTGRNFSSPPGLDPGPSSPYSVAIPTELTGRGTKNISWGVMAAGA